MTKNFKNMHKKVNVMARVSVCLAIMAALADGHCPVRELPSTVGRRPLSTDGGFYLTLSGNPEHYEPGALYTVSLRVRVIMHCLNTSNASSSCNMNP